MNSRSEEKILCPWCGAEMIYKVRGDSDWYKRSYMECLRCFATSPVIAIRLGESTMSLEARCKAAALRRYTPQLKPMTLEEALGRLTVWREYRDKQETKAVIIKEYWNGNLELRGYYLFRENPERNQYGKTWRCWERKPTDEERSAAEWET